MISFFGVTKSEQLRALIDICFNPKTEKTSYQLVDEAIQTDNLSSEQYRVLPLLYSKADLNQFSEFTATKIRSAHKHTLYRNHLLLRRAINFQEMLCSAGFKESIFLKGVAHCLRSHSGIGSRPMVDIDILVKDLHKEPEKILYLLEQHQFKVTGTTSRSLTAVSHEGFEFDVHWYLSDWALSAKLIDDLFNRADRIVFRDQTFWVPCIEHHFMHVLGHGVLSPSLAFDARWVIDVLTIITENKHLNVEHLIDITNKFNARSKLIEALKIIANETPQTINIDRKSLIHTANSIQKESFVIKWLFNEKSYATDIGDYRKSRVTWFKVFLRSYLYVPVFVSGHNKVPLSKAFGLSVSLPSLSIFQSMNLIFHKVLEKFPHFFYNRQSKIRGNKK
jgi:hypothetical protein